MRAACVRSADRVAAPLDPLYSAIERLPHIRGGIVIDQNRAQAELESLVAEMERRYELFRAAAARDLRAFNASKPAAERLPLLFLVHDEFAEWMLTETYKDAVAATVARLGVMARAAGIHLIFAAQRPDANVMPIQLRDNLGKTAASRSSSERNGACAKMMSASPESLAARWPCPSNDSAPFMPKAISDVPTLATFIHAHLGVDKRDLRETARIGKRDVEDRR